MSIELKTSSLIGLIVVIIGFILLAIGVSIQLPNQYVTFLGIPYAVNQAFSVNVLLKLFSTIFGFMMITFGCLALIYQYLNDGKSKNKKNFDSQTIPPPPPQ